MANVSAGAGAGTVPAPAGVTGIRINRTLWLIMPALLLMLFFFVLPILLIFAIGFNPSEVGVIDFRWDQLTLESFARFFQKQLYWGSLVRSVGFALLTALVALILGYPVAYIVAKERRPGRANLYMILILASMQLDLVIRMYGLMILLGDNGLISGSLISAGIISDPLPLMYNGLGVMIGMVQLALPFMILSLIGVIQGIDPSLEEAAHSLGAGTWRRFFTITFPMSMPGVLSGCLLAFAIAVGSYAVPVLMGGWRVMMVPMHIYQQVSEVGNWRFGSAIACILFAVCLFAVYLYYRFAQKYVGGVM